MSFDRYNYHMEVKGRMNRAEQMLRELYGYTDEQLLEEVRLAEEELMREGGGEAVTEEEMNDMLERLKQIKRRNL